MSVALRAVVNVLLIAAAACGGSPPAHAPATATTAPPTEVRSEHRRRDSAAGSRRDASRDLSVDDSLGGHTLKRHVGRTDEELAERLRREPDISAASTWTDRETAERVVGAALASAGGRLTAWERREGRRPNLVLHYEDRTGATLGRSLSRGASSPEPCHRALVVLKWDERRDRFFVLTAYPEADR